MDKQKLAKFFSVAVMLIVGGGVGYMAASLGLDSGKSASGMQVLGFIISFLPVFILVIGVHEAGHAIAGTWVNFDFRMYVVGPFLWDKEVSGWKFKWNKNVNVAGGLVICIPNSTENLAKRFSVYSLGGPLASLILTGVAYGAKLIIEALNTNHTPLLDISESTFTLISFLSLMIFFVTIVPMHMGGFYTDGARALRFLRGGDTARFETLLMSLVAKSYGGVRPRLLSKEEITEALALAEKLNAKTKVYIHYYLHMVAFDEGDLDQAETHLKDYVADIESIPKGLNAGVFLDAAFFYAYARKDLTQAEEYWKQFVPSAMISKAMVLATEAALLNLKNERAQTHAVVEAAMKELPNMMDKGVAIALGEKLDDLKSNKL